MHKNPLELWDTFGYAGRGVILTLLIMSIVSVWIAADRFWAYRRATRASRRFAPDGARLMRLGRVQDAHTAALAAAGASGSSARPCRSCCGPMPRSASPPG